MITKTLATAILSIAGWKASAEFPFQYPKLIIISAPHTSMWDFIWGRLYFMSIGLPVTLLIKAKYFFWPLGPILRFFGAIPVHLGKDTTFVKSIVNELNAKERINLIVTPEGTRKATKRWRLGFYFISKEAKIPIMLGYLDYKKKLVGVGPIVIPGENQQEDMANITKFYKAEWAKHPSKFIELG